MKINSRARHILNAITWRIIASATTFFLALFFFKDHPNAMENTIGIVVAESLLKWLFTTFTKELGTKVNWEFQRKNEL